MGVRACIHACTAPLLIHYHPILYLSSCPVVLALSIEDLCILIPKTSRLQTVCTTVTSSLLTNMSQVSKKWLPFLCFLSWASLWVVWTFNLLNLMHSQAPHLSARASYILVLQTCPTIHRQHFMNICVCIYVCMCVCMWSSEYTHGCCS